MTVEGCSFFGYGSILIFLFKNLKIRQDERDEYYVVLKSFNFWQTVNPVKAVTEARERKEVHGVENNWEIHRMGQVN